MAICHEAERDYSSHGVDYDCPLIVSLKGALSSFGMHCGLAVMISRELIEDRAERKDSIYACFITVSCRNLFGNEEELAVQNEAFVRP